MAAALAKLVIPGGVAALKCPVTGIPVISATFGFAPNGDHSPHLRFFSDWHGDTWVADPGDLSDEQVPYQTEVVRILSTWDTRGRSIAQCVERMPSSVLVLELTNPLRGFHGRDICFVAFDLAPAVRSAHLHLHPIVDAAGPSLPPPGRRM